MNWLNGLALSWHCMVVGSNLGEPKLNLNFWYFWFWIECEELKETLEVWAT